MKLKTTTFMLKKQKKTLRVNNIDTFIPAVFPILNKRLIRLYVRFLAFNQTFV